jgi:hypothetical protein
MTRTGHGAEECFSIGGLTIRLKEVPELLTDSMTKAFSLSRISTGEMGLVMTAAMLDGGEFVEAMPRFLRELYERLPENETPFAFASPDGEFGVIVKNEGTASYALVTPENHAIRLFCQRLTAARGPLHFQSVLIPVIKHLLLQRNKLLVHAGSVAARNGHALLFVGLSGSGKTTSCIALTRAGFRFIADDLVVLSHADGRVIVEGIRENMNLTKQTITFFPDLFRFDDEPREEYRGKVPVNPEALFGAEGLCDRAVIDAVVVTRIGEEGPLLRPCPPPRILEAILQNHTFEAGIPIPRKSMNIFWDMLETVSTYTLMTGSDPEKMGRYLFHEFHGC